MQSIVYRNWDKLNIRSANLSSLASQYRTMASPVYSKMASQEDTEMKTSSSLQQILCYISQERSKDNNQNSKEGNCLKCLSCIFYYATNH